MKLKKLRITRAKRTAMGRFVCRLLGDECGAVAMEYVVIALLVVAAAVGAVLYFGGAIKYGFDASARTIMSDDPAAESDSIKKDRIKIDAKGKAASKKVRQNLGGGTTE